MLKTIVLNFLHGHELDARSRALDQLTNSLRLNDDASGLASLRLWIVKPAQDGELTAEFVANQLLRDRLGEMCYALLERDKQLLFKNTFELRYRPGAADQEIINRYKNLVDEASRALSKDVMIDDYEFSELATKTFVREFNMKTANIFGDKIFEINHYDVIIDIPPFGKDQIRDLFVHLPDGSANILEVSGIAESIAMTFRYWARVLRVFFHPSVHMKLKQFLNENPDISKTSLFVGPCEVVFQVLHGWLGAKLGAVEIEGMQKKGHA